MQAPAGRRDLRVGGEVIDDLARDAAEIVALLVDAVVQVDTGVGVAFTEDETYAVAAEALRSPHGGVQAAPGCRIGARGELAGVRVDRHLGRFAGALLASPADPLRQHTKLGRDIHDGAIPPQSGRSLSS